MLFTGLLSPPPHTTPLNSNPILCAQTYTIKWGWNVLGVQQYHHQLRCVWEHVMLEMKWCFWHCICDINVCACFFVCSRNIQGFLLWNHTDWMSTKKYTGALSFISYIYMKNMFVYFFNCHESSAYLLLGLQYSTRNSVEFNSQYT